MGYTYERKINYYETDKMGVVHHSNYIRYMEEARCNWLEHEGLLFSYLEQNGITIPVLGVDCTFKHHVTMDDVIEIFIFIQEYNKVHLTIGYEIKDKKNGNIVLTGQTKHCFTDKSLRPIVLKKYAPDINDKFEKALQQDMAQAQS